VAVGDREEGRGIGPARDSRAGEHAEVMPLDIFIANVGDREDGEPGGAALQERERRRGLAGEE
jgi:hypothetical protein